MILDTNAVSAFADGEPAALDEIGRAEYIAIPVIVLGEFLFGIRQSRRRADYEEWIGGTLSNSPLLDVTSVTAELYADLRVELKQLGRPIPENDAWIAALCLQHSLPLLSRDRHFDLVTGLRRIAW